MKDPRQIGNRYFSSYWRKVYTFIGTDGPYFIIRWDDAKEASKHMTAWDNNQDFEVSKFGSLIQILPGRRIWSREKQTAFQSYLTGIGIMKCRPSQDLHTEECIKHDATFCPECGGVYFAGSSCLYEHRDSQCSFRYVNQKWVPSDNK